MAKDIVRNAFLLAAHKHQHQKYGDSPYLIHLYDVVRTLGDFGFADDKYVAAAWLHDVIEDTPTHYSEVEQNTSREVAEMVFALTDEIGRNRKERKQKTLPKLIACPEAIIVKLADWIANLKDARRNNPGFLEMYKKDFPDFKNACYRFRPDNTEGMWDAAQSLLYKKQKP